MNYLYFENMNEQLESAESLALQILIDTRCKTDIDEQDLLTLLEYLLANVSGAKENLHKVFFNGEI